MDVKRYNRAIYKARMTPHYLLSTYRCTAKYKGFEWGLTDEQFYDLIQQNCHYCGEPPAPRSHKSTSGALVCNGVDRKDSGRGYVIENVVPCCKACQFMKRATPYDEFLAHLRKAGNFQTERRLLAPISGESLSPTQP